MTNQTDQTPGISTEAELLAGAAELIKYMPEATAAQWRVAYQAYRDGIDAMVPGERGPHYDGVSVPVLRQALWDCYGAAGADQDGDKDCPSAGVMTPDVHVLALEAVRELRRDYDESEGEPDASLPDGVFGRIELPGRRNHTGWVTDETRFGVQAAIVRGWDGEVIAEVFPGPGVQFLHLATPLKRPGPQAAIGATPASSWDGGDDEPWADDYTAPDRA